MTADAPQTGDGETCILIGDHAHARVSPDAPPELIDALGRLADAARQEFGPAAPSEPPAEVRPDNGHAWWCNMRPGGNHDGCNCRPAEAQQDDEPVTRGVARALWTQRLSHDPAPRERAAFLAGWDAALAARPSADTETLRRVRELADELDADAERAYQRSCGAYRDEGSDGQYRAYEDAADRLRAALDGKR